MSPPEAPAPVVIAFGWPRYSSAHADAPLPPAPPICRQSSLPPPSPSSEPANRLFARETWIAGSPAAFVPHPFAPIVCDCSSPLLNVGIPVAATAVGAAPTRPYTSAAALKNAHD